MRSAAADIGVSAVAHIQADIVELFPGRTAIPERVALGLNAERLRQRDEWGNTANRLHFYGRRVVFISHLERIAWMTASAGFSREEDVCVRSVVFGMLRQEDDQAVWTTATAKIRNHDRWRKALYSWSEESRTCPSRSQNEPVAALQQR